MEIKGKTTFTLVKQIATIIALFGVFATSGCSDDDGGDSRGDAAFTGEFCQTLVRYEEQCFETTSDIGITIIRCESTPICGACETFIDDPSLCRLSSGLLQTCGGCE